MATLFVALLSQLIRVVPRAPAANVGRAAWLVPIAAAPLILLYLLFIRALLRKKREGCSLCAVFEDSLGRSFGRLAVFLISLWLVFYCGFLLRSIAERFTSTVYPYSGTGGFVVTMGLLCLLAGMGRFKAVARCAMIFRPILLAFIFLILFISLFSVDPNCLLPVSAADALPVAKSTLPLLDLTGPVVYMGFLEGHTRGSVRLRDYLPWIGLLLAVSVLLCVCCVGMYGARLTARATLPVFLLVRDMTVFGSVERVEPLIITAWVLTDFTLMTTVLFIAAENLRWCFGIRDSGGGFLSLSGGRWLIPLCAAAAIAVGLRVGTDIVSMDALSGRIIPGIDLAVILLVMPLVFLIGRIRRKL